MIFVSLECHVKEKTNITHLTTTLSARLVAVRVKPSVCLTVTGATRLVTPPASGTWQVRPAETHPVSSPDGQKTLKEQCTEINARVLFLAVTAKVVGGTVAGVTTGGARPPGAGGLVVAGVQ